MAKRYPKEIFNEYKPSAEIYAGMPIARAVGFGLDGLGRAAAFVEKQLVIKPMDRVIKGIRKKDSL